MVDAKAQAPGPDSAVRIDAAGFERLGGTIRLGATASGGGAVHMTLRAV
ncbi:MAG TPA: hypothetical protein VI997_04175 [Candidatus Thermoplasmatota archaeon]|nr:hypothetical protein [Candidatus Thermoplasmatota archaeon]